MFLRFTQLIVIATAITILVTPLVVEVRSPFVASLIWCFWFYATVSTHNLLPLLYEHASTEENKEMVRTRLGLEGDGTWGDTLLNFKSFWSIFCLTIVLSLTWFTWVALHFILTEKRTRHWNDTPAGKRRKLFANLLRQASIF